MSEIKDLTIIGGGPSALAAAIYTAREDIDTTVYEKTTIGGLAATIDKIDNYPGYADGIEGMDLADQLSNQAKRFGAKIEFGEATKLVDKGSYKIVTIDGQDIKTKAVLIATGRRYGDIGVSGEKEFFGKGVHYCATCDGAFYNGKNIIVVGGANSAIQESIYLTRFASHIDILVRSTIKANKILQHELDKYIKAGKITVHLETTVKEILGIDGKVNSIVAVKDSKEFPIQASAVFVFTGLHPNTEFLRDSGIKLSDREFIESDEAMRTSIPGVFVCGDVRDGATMQIASAVGDGVTAAISIREYLSKTD